MKIKITPLFITAIGLILYGLYLWFIVFPKDTSWSKLAALVVFVTGIISLGVYLLLRRILRTKIWTQLWLELILIAAVVFYIYVRT